MIQFKTPHRDRLMFADDMFWKGTQQVFSVRTGERLGYTGRDDPEPQQAEDENQLTLNL